MSGMNRRGQKFFYFLAFLLLLSLALHAVEFNHDHLHHLFGDGAAASLHGGEAQVLLALTFFVFCVFLMCALSSRELYYLKYATLVADRGNIFFKGCSRGIVHGKPF